MNGPVLKWPGSKWNIAEWITGHMPEHDAYIEPYFGSGAVFFNKAPSNVEMLNDRDGELVNFFRVLRDRPNELAAALELTPWAREEYDYCRRRLGKPRGNKVERARRLAVAMWQAIGQRRTGNVQGVVTGGWRSRCMEDQSPVATWQRLPDRVRYAAGRILQAQIANRPALDVVERHAFPEVLIYADPPYHLATRARRLYAHEMSDEEHRALLKALEAHPGSVLLSGYQCALYQEHLGHWKHFETSARAQNNAVRQEVLWLNPVAMQRLEQQRSQLTLLEMVS
ncbi:MAG TPA: DNA adenine methylase [Abditibacteriaceae bacterium]|jgi:DNA adenine methylase